ncbi:hypothetical protein BKH41_02165 [Helicobacter sp. 12S02232-10]|uniref:hypothetical protein n=1 Tax=Helicobacter sp. 12S02232-10 TaxID=1476197 RepID=UPI000BDCFC74|nr:hypothetical protein [Helicobacter sp. 12S02232-10]PAF49492.1 hypothetical protein BKH41_02165 [Helicobacter sp. 12S02232-10]
MIRILFLIFISYCLLKAFSSVATSDRINAQEKPLCFLIKQIDFILLGAGTSDIKKILKKFSFTRSVSKPYVNTCMDSKQIKTMKQAALSRERK